MCVFLFEQLFLSPDVTVWEWCELAGGNVNVAPYRISESVISVRVRVCLEYCVMKRLLDPGR